jgi:hypothetical protein
MLSRSITHVQVAGAFVVAIAADVVQLPLNLAFFGSLLTVVGAAADIPLELLDVAIDAATACIISGLLGFHWTLLPSFVLELMPGLDAAPTWTACVAYLAWKRKRQGQIVSART